VRKHLLCNKIQHHKLQLVMSNLLLHNNILEDILYMSYHHKSFGMFLLHKGQED